MFINLFNFLSFRLSPPVYNITRSSTIETFILMEKDNLQFIDNNTDLFLVFQPHRVMGDIFMNIETIFGNNKTFRCDSNTSFFITDYKKVSVYYQKRGATVVSFWQLPKGLCNMNSVYSTHQNEAYITINEIVPQQNLCWFFNFRKKPIYSFIFNKGKYLMIAENLTRKVYQSPTILQNQDISKNFVVILSPDNSGKADLKFNITSTIPYADWTDIIHKFIHISPENINDFDFISKNVSFQSNHSLNIEQYLFTKRIIKKWVIALMISFILLIFSYTTILFFSGKYIFIEKNDLNKDEIKDNKESKKDI